MYSEKWLIRLYLVFVVCGVFGFPPFCHGEEAFLSDYRVGAGDVLKISVWKEPDLSLDASMVRTDGKITFPLLDDIQASSLTTMELKAVIEKRLSEYVEAPQVTVTLINPGSQKYYILGEVNSTGEYPLLKNLTIIQAFSIAKGFTEWASKKEIILFRREKGKERIIRVNYKDIVKGDFSNNIPIKADDTIIVP
ncbi:MAG: polysaccharide export protein [Desulfobacteraceae bacterium]|nr:polysaccharide export protein [Desulfobacteraceae bacterium]